MLGSNYLLKSSLPWPHEISTVSLADLGSCGWTSSLTKENVGAIMNDEDKRKKAIEEIREGGYQYADGYCSEGFEDWEI